MLKWKKNCAVEYSSTNGRFRIIKECLYGRKPKFWQLYVDGERFQQYSTLQEAKHHAALSQKFTDVYLARKEERWKNKQAAETA